MDSLFNSIRLHLESEDSKDQILVTLQSSGAYVARMHVNYELEHEKFSKSVDGITAGTTHTVRIPNVASNINIKAEDCVFFGIWNTIFDEFFQPIDGQISLSIGGTTLNPNWKRK